MIEGLQPPLLKKTSSVRFSLKRQIKVSSSYDVKHNISWYEGADRRSIDRSLQSVFHVPAGAKITLRTPEGDIIHDVNTIPNKAEVYLEVTFPHDELQEKALGVRLEYEVAQEMKSGYQNWLDDENDEDDHLVGFEHVNEQSPLLTSPLLPLSGCSRRGPGVRNKGGTTGLQGLLTNGLGAGDGSLSPDISDSQKISTSYLTLRRILAHLANERTFLAWTRTAMKLLAASVVALSLAQDATTGAWQYAILGCGFMALSPLCLWIGFDRYQYIEEVMMGNVYDIYFSFKTDFVQKIAMVLLLVAIFLLWFNVLLFY